MTIPQDQQEEEKRTPLCVKFLAYWMIAGVGGIICIISANEAYPRSDFSKLFIICISAIFIGLGATGWMYYIHEGNVAEKLKNQLETSEAAADYWKEQYQRVLGLESTPPDPGS